MDRGSSRTMNLTPYGKLPPVRLFHLVRPGKFSIHYSNLNDRNRHEYILCVCVCVCFNIQTYVQTTSFTPNLLRPNLRHLRLRSVLRPIHQPPVSLSILLLFICCPTLLALPSMRPRNSPGLFPLFSTVAHSCPKSAISPAPFPPWLAHMLQAHFSPFIP